MPTYDFTTVDVFTQTRYTGNPLAIVQLPTEDALSTYRMQTIAKEFNLSETVFLTALDPASDGVPAFRLRIFMTAQELPFAGHPTIGAAWYALGTLLKGAGKGRFVCNAGTINAEFDAVTGVARASIPHAFHTHTQYIQPALESLQPGFHAAGIKSIAVDVVSPVKGMTFTCVWLETLEDLGQVRVNGIPPQAARDDDWDVGFTGSYFYVRERSEDGIEHIRARMVEGTIEDPATGSAACALACLLASKMAQEPTAGPHRVQKVNVTQGVEMGRRSEIGVEVTTDRGEDGEIEVKKVVLSGSAVQVMKGTLEV